MTLRKNLQMLITVVLLILAVLSLHWEERVSLKEARPEIKKALPVMHQGRQQEQDAATGGALAIHLQKS